MLAADHIALARRAMAKGDGVAAEEQARRAMEIAPLDAEAKYWLARALHRQGRLAAAAELYDKLVDSSEKCRDTAAFFGRCLYELGRIEEAEAACDIALTNEPANMVALFTKAQCLCVRQQYEQADHLFIAATYTQDFVDARIRLFRGSPIQSENAVEHKAIARSFWENYSACVGKQGWFDQALREAQAAPEIGAPETHQPEIWSTHVPSNILPNGHQIMLASYASDLFRVGQKNLALSAIRYGGIDHAVLWTRADIEKTGFYRQHKAILDLVRGSGGWAWKPFVIYTQMQLSADGDYIIYYDSGRGGGHPITQSVKPLIDWCEDHPHQILPGVLIPVAGPNKHWTKRDCFVVMNCDEEAYWSHPQVLATFSVWKNSDFARAFVREWLEAVVDPRAVSDHPNVCGLPNHPGFLEHRYDQSILTNLVIRHGLKLPVFESADINALGAMLEQQK